MFYNETRWFGYKRNANTHENKKSSANVTYLLGNKKKMSCKNAENKREK